MSARVAINGFGRIGRMVMRAAKERRLDVDFVAINDVADLEPLGMVLRYDSIHGRYPGTVEWRDSTLIVDGDEIRVFKVGDKRSGDPFAFPWHDLEIDVVIESSGLFRKRDELQRHLDAGAKRVLLTVPGKDSLDATIVLGVNDDTLRTQHRIISNSSCTTNCAAPIAKILEEAYTITSSRPRPARPERSASSCRRSPARSKGSPSGSPSHPVPWSTSPCTRRRRPTCGKSTT